MQPPLGLIKFEHSNRKPNEIINVAFFSTISDDGRAGWDMPKAHAPSPFTVALHPPDVLQLADLDEDDVPSVSLSVSVSVFASVLQQHDDFALQQALCPGHLFNALHQQVLARSLWGLCLMLAFCDQVQSPSSSVTPHTSRDI